MFVFEGVQATPAIDGLHCATVNHHKEAGKGEACQMDRPLID
jgi:hypothetical protein